MPHEDTRRHLESLYARSDDPWSHRTSPYEQAKFAATLAATGDGPFQDALEIGCGNGTLLALLAPRCARLTGLDCVPGAVALAQQAVAGQPHVAVHLASVPDDLPPIRPDLVILSEVLYFLSPTDIRQLADWLRERRARIVCVNWLGATDEELDGTSAMDVFTAALGRLRDTRMGGGYRIDVFAAG